MKRRSFAVTAACVLSDVDSPDVDASIVVTKQNGDKVSVPASVQSFGSKEAFMKYMTDRASRMWDMHEQIVDENANFEKAIDKLVENAKRL